MPFARQGGAASELSHGSRYWVINITSFEAFLQLLPFAECRRETGKALGETGGKGELKCGSRVLWRKPGDLRENITSAERFLYLGQDRSG